MSQELNLETSIADAIRATGGDVPENAIPQGFLIICEWETLEGDLFVTETRSQNLPEWRRLGLLQYAIQTEDELDFGEED